MKRRTYVSAFVVVTLMATALIASSKQFKYSVFSDEASVHASTERPNPDSRVDESDNTSRVDDVLGGKQPNSGDTLIPDVVLWSAVFGLPEKLESAAENARNSGADDSLWRNYFERQAGLSPQSAIVLYDHASRYRESVTNNTEQVKVLADSLKSLHEPGRTPSEEAQMQLKKIMDLQHDRENIVNRYRDELKSRIGNAAYLAFELWIKEDFSKGFRMFKKSNQPQVSDGVDMGNGLIPFIQAPKRAQSQLEGGVK